MNKGHYSKVLLASILFASCMTAKAPKKTIHLVTSRDVTAEEVDSAYKKSMVKGVFGTYLTTEAGLRTISYCLNALDGMKEAEWTTTLQDSALALGLAYVTKWLGGWTLEKYSEAFDNHMIARTIKEEEA